MDVAYTARASAFALFASGAMAVSPLAPNHAVAHTVPQQIRVAPCAERCGMTLDLETEYGHDSGPGMVGLTGWAKAYRDVSGRIYIVGDPIEQVLVFDSGGRFLRRIGRKGSGPGELRDGSSLVVTGDGEFSVFDRGRSVILNFDHTGRLRSEARTVGWIPTGLHTYPWEDSWVVHVTTLHTRDRIGFPLHLVNVRTGEIGRSFGSLTSGRELGSDRIDPATAVTEDRRVWMAKGFERYEIGLWEMNRRLLLLRHEAKWFPEVPRADLVHGGKPTPFIYALALSESDSLLWVLGSVADEESWDGLNASEAYSLSASQDYDRIYDDILEVIDLRTNRVIASQRFEHSYHLIDAGLIGRLAITATGSVRYQTFKVQLDALVGAR